jgi:hypothetical protein
MADDAKDVLLKRIQVTIAILGGLATLIVGVYNVRKVMSSSGQGEIAAVVATPQGKAVAGARVELYTAENVLLNAGQTDAQGAYAREDVEAGSYILKLSKAGFDPEVVTVRVAPKKTTDLNIQMQPLAGASGGQLRSALEEVGASWLKTVGKPKAESQQQS